MAEVVKEIKLSEDADVSVSIQSASPLEAPKHSKFDVDSAADGTLRGVPVAGVLGLAWVQLLRQLSSMC